MSFNRSQAVTRSSSGSDGSTSRGRNRSSERAAEEDEMNTKKTTPEQRRQHTVGKALKKLQPGSTPEIVSSNLKILMDSMRHPSEVRSDEEDFRQGQVHSRKRLRSHSRSEKSKTVRQPKPNTERPLKRPRITSQVGVPGQPAPGLPTLNPQPIRFGFLQHPTKDRSDKWFVEEFRELFRRMEKFFDAYFCTQNLDEKEVHQPGASNHTPELLNYVVQVAEQDQGEGDRDNLLRDKAQRKWLLMGILMRILQAKVFDADLFGANKEEKELLFAIEKATFTSEGFSRTNLRSAAVKRILGSNPVTKDFHREVAKLTAQVSLLFKPLSNYLYAIAPPESKTKALIWDQYQSLHNIIATAAYLSLCIRLSPTIFFFTHLLPNEGYDPEDQSCLEIESFVASKNNIVDAYTAAINSWKEKEEALQEEVRNLTDGIMPDEQRAKKAKASLAAHINARPKHTALTHRALCKIGVWPNIRRYKPGSEEEEKAVGLVPLEEKTGFRIYEISKSAGVFYFGPVQREGQSSSLKQFVEEKRKMRGRKSGSRIMPSALALTVAAAVVLGGLKADFLGATLLGLTDGLREVGGSLMQSLVALSAIPEEIRHFDQSILGWVLNS